MIKRDISNLDDLVVAMTALNQLNINYRIEVRGRSGTVTRYTIFILSDGGSNNEP